MLDQNKAAQGRQYPRSRRRYTSVVITRNYRAPKVIMSHGDYTSAIDKWSLGCIFWGFLDATRKRKVSKGWQLLHGKPDLGFCYKERGVVAST